MKIKKTIEFEGNFVQGEINGGIASLEIHSDDYTSKQLQELIEELQTVMSDMPKEQLTRFITTTDHNTIGTIHSGESVVSKGWDNKGVNSNTKATFED
mgnify:CR=1 FL=1